MKVVPTNTKILATLVGVEARSLLAALEESNIEAAEGYCRQIAERVATVAAALKCIKAGAAHLVIEGRAS